jgi:Ca-activated chloride channel family protein
VEFSKGCQSLLGVCQPKVKRRVLTLLYSESNLDERSGLKERSKDMVTRKRMGLIALLILGLTVQACSVAGAPSMYDSQTSTADYGPTYGGLNPVNGEPYHDVFFEDYGVNPFIDTEDDHLSTFALDVDTGSYTIMRRYLQDGNLPPDEAIRVEEFVNYFDMGYALPEQEAFSIHLDGGLTPFVQNERYRVLRIGIQGYDIPDDDRKDAMLTFVIDVSGSMNMENRLGAVKDALTSLVETLRPTDQVGIIIYGSRARKILDPTPVSEKQAILTAIHRLEPGGSTNAEEGLQMGYKMASRSFLVGGINRIILCSDGVANVGNTGPDKILESIREYASQGIQLTTVGFGMGNYNDVLMEQLADDGDGFYAYVDSPEEAEKLFVEDMTGTLQAIAMDAKVQVDFNPDVVSRFRLIGFENRALEDDEFRDDSVDAGEIGAGHSVTALYEIKLTELAQGEIATVFMRWQDPDTYEVLERSRSIETSDLASTFADTSASFRLAVMVAEFGELLRDSYWAQQFNLNDLVEQIGSQDWPQFEDEEILEFEELVRKAAELSVK